MSGTTIDQQFIEFVVKSIVGNPDAVKIERRIDEKGVLLELSVDPEDLGRVIGKRGATAQSLRTLLRALGTKNDARYNLKIVDDGEGPARRERHEEATEQRRDDDDNRASEEKVEDEVQEEPKPTDEAENNKDADEEEVDDDDNQDQDDKFAKHRKDLEDLDDLDV